MMIARIIPLLMAVSTVATAAEYRAVRTTKPPVIDADLADEVWQTAPEITGFTQHDPDDGKPASQQTFVRIAYDEQAIYFAARLEDTNPVTRTLGRRDNNHESDWFRIYIDAQHDKLTGAEFWVNPANVQLDGIIYNDIYDDWSWDAVWESAAKVVAGGWVVEAKIPYSQLRFPDRPVHVWGINLSRKIFARQEIDWLVNTPKSQSGLASRFADLVGIEGIHPQRALELMPYAVARTNLDSAVPSNDPLNRSTAYKMAGGLDVKYSLSSNLRLTGTVNPDFGQVEVDPAVINLSDTETFFSEKRPFFTEGSSIFSFGSGPANFRASFNFSPPSLFYSRRIGRSPQGVGSIAADYLYAPTETKILGAGKLTGKIGKGWTVGVLDAVTSAEHARYAISTSALAPPTFGRQTVEPLSNYIVARATKEYGKSRVGVIYTDVKRDVPRELTFLRDGAHVLGVDGYTKLKKDNWLWEWQASGSNVTGSPTAINLTQRSSGHYFHRPDADHLTYDPLRTSLSGFGGRTMIGKQTGHWRPNVQVAAWSPGFESNDVGFMQRVDAITSHVVMNYVNDEPTKRFRERSWWVGKYQNWNFGHDLLANGLYGNWFAQVKSYWYSYGWGGISGPALDDRKTRGGPLTKRPSSYNGGIGIGSDTRKKIYFEGEIEKFRSKDSGWEHGGRITATFRPSSNVKLTLGPSFYRSFTYAQYVTQALDASAVETYGRRYVFAGIDQRTFELSTRVDWTANARLSFQLYLQPFIATGDYHDFRRLARARTREYVPYAYTGNPDFNYHSVHGSGVVRWEFRPGSALYLVWSENREDTVTLGDFRLRRDFSALRSAPSKDVFLVKVSYWLPL
jgi:hypothetical protein